MRVTQKYLDELTYKILGAAIEVHKQLGPGLLESLYEKCFMQELTLRGLNYVSQQCVQAYYKGMPIDAELRFDVLVEGLIITELKAIDEIASIHKAKLLTYMELLQKPKGIVINFNCANIFKEGQRTVVNKFYGMLPKL